MRSFTPAVAVLAIAVMAASAVPSAAQQRETKRQVRADARADAPAGRLDDKTEGATIRASQLIGMNIQNAQGKSVGEINDLVLDGRSGKVRYAAVTYGGFLGIGDKMFAVPFEAFHCQKDPDGGDDYVLILNVTQEQLAGAQGFDEDHWPNFADRTFTSDLDRRYKIERRTSDVERGVDVDVNRRGVDVDVDAKPDRDRDR